MNDRKLPSFLIKDSCLSILKENKGVEAVIAWNRWRLDNPKIRPDLSDADLSSLDLGGIDEAGGVEEDPGALEHRGLDLDSANLIGTNFSKTILKGASFGGADLSGANLSEANLKGAYFTQARLEGTILNKADLAGANLGWCNMEAAKLRMANLNLTQLISANLRRADLCDVNANGCWMNGADLELADLSRARIFGANLTGANLTNADLSHAKIKDADLTQTMFVGTNTDQAQFVNCSIFGLSIWDLKGNPKLTEGLVISPKGEQPVKVDSLEAAQLQYVLLSNQKTGKVIDSVIKSSILILGRFGHRKPVLDSLRVALRSKGYIPIIFDFESPEERSLTETIRLLAHLARFIVADLTDPSSIPQELESIIPHVEIVVKPLIEGKEQPYAMSRDFVTRHRNQFLKLYRYQDVNDLINNLDEEVIKEAEDRREEIIQEREQAEEEWDPS